MSSKENSTPLVPINMSLRNDISDNEGEAILEEWYNVLQHMSIVSNNGTLVNRLTTSNKHMEPLDGTDKSFNWLTNSNVSRTQYVLYRLSTGCSKEHSQRETAYWGEPDMERIGRNGQLDLWILGRPYIRGRDEPTGFKKRKLLSEISSRSSRPFN